MRIILAVFFLLGIWSQTLSAFSLHTNNKIKNLLHDIEHNVYNMESNESTEVEGLTGNYIISKMKV